MQDVHGCRHHLLDVNRPNIDARAAMSMNEQLIYSL